MVSKGGVPKGGGLSLYILQMMEMCTLFIYMRWES